MVPPSSRDAKPGVGGGSTNAFVRPADTTALLATSDAQTLADAAYIDKGLDDLSVVAKSMYRAQQDINTELDRQNQQMQMMNNQVDGYNERTAQLNGRIDHQINKYS